MAHPRQKIAKLAQLIKIRKMQLDQETFVLLQIQQKRDEAAQALHLSQRIYIDGVEKLNQERQSPDRRMIIALEQGVDYAKALWYQRLKNLRSIEEDERRQMVMVMEAQKRMNMLEKLDDRYVEQLHEQIKVQEQKQLDEFAIQIARRKVND